MIECHGGNSKAISPGPFQEARILGLIVYLGGVKTTTQIQDSCFTQNNRILIDSQKEGSEITLLLQNITFLTNKDKSSGSSPLILIGLSYTTIDSCFFEGNVGYHHSLWPTLSMYYCLKGTLHL